jgi:hypothetical protein
MVLCSVGAYNVDASDTNEVASAETIEETDNSVNSQLNTLYQQVSDYLDMDISYVKQLHILAGGSYLYADTQPNIYIDKTVQTLNGPMDIPGANTVYQLAPFVECENIERPSKYYMPDAIYSVCYDIQALMGQRYYYNRGDMQEYFDSLQEDTKYRIIFYEAVLLYTGEPEETVNKLYTAYEKILYDKRVNENVVESYGDGQIRIKDKFLNIVNDIGITSEKSINYLAVMLSFDGNLAASDNLESLKESYTVPYKLNYTSRENMMIAAMSLAGKVRYTWGGGHSGASLIDGINPVWSQWEALYPDEPYSTYTDEEGEDHLVRNIGFGKCLKSGNSWCPIHGTVSGSYHGGTVYSLDQYIEARKDILNVDELSSDKYREMLSTIDFKNGINIHTLDGLDCSGYASWLYNQITDKYTINSTAVDFTNQAGIKKVTFGSELLPGDVFSWTEHIVIIIGKATESGKAYVTIEQTPNVLKFGVVYYSGASQSDIDRAYQIAKEANELIGGINSQYEKPSKYCMNDQGKITVSVNTDASGRIQISQISYYIDEAGNIIVTSGLIPDSFDDQELITTPPETEDGYTTYTIKFYMNNTDNSDDNDSDNSSEDESSNSSKTVTKTEHVYAIGRFQDPFIDENTLVGDVNKTIKSMTADEIIQYTITKLPISYVSGYSTYEGEIFDKSKTASSLYDSITNIILDDEGNILMGSIK